MRNSIIIFLTLLSFTFSCKTDFEVNDSWKDNTVVYCVLNQQDSVSYVRIGKSFLGKEDAYVMASHGDSLVYSEDITVKLEKYEDNNLLETIVLVKTEDIVKDSGVFAIEDYYLFKTTTPLDVDNKYKLIIYIPSLDKTISAETHLINDFQLSNITYVFFNSQVNFLRSNAISFGWTCPKYSRMFEPKIVFNYYEITNFIDTVEKSITWELGDVVASDFAGGSNLISVIIPSDFFKFVGSSLKEVDNSIIRKAINVDFRIDVGNNDLFLYTELNKPSSGIAQDKPIYSNIENGYGLFCSRYTKVYIGNSLQYLTEDSLACGQYTKNLNFLDHSDNIGNCN